MDDGSCVVGGCADSRATNFASLASYDNGSCHPVFEGCTDASALNYRPLANWEDGTCVYVGCTISIAINFDPTATFMGFCVLPIPGCMNSFAANYLPAATVPFPFPGSPDGCVHLGCTVKVAFNYDPTATHNDGGCIPKFEGCTDDAGSNFKDFYNTEDGSCRLPGCADQASNQYNPNAAFDDGCSCTNSCGGRRALTGADHRRHLSTGCMDPAALTYDNSHTSHSSDACEPHTPEVTPSDGKG